MVLLNPCDIGIVTYGVWGCVDFLSLLGPLVMRSEGLCSSSSSFILPGPSTVPGLKSFFFFLIKFLSFFNDNFLVKKIWQIFIYIFIFWWALRIVVGKSVHTSQVWFSLSSGCSWASMSKSRLRPIPFFGPCVCVGINIPSSCPCVCFCTVWQSHENLLGSFL